MGKFNFIEVTLSKTDKYLELKDLTIQSMCAKEDRTTFESRAKNISAMSCQEK